MKTTNCKVSFEFDGKTDRDVWALGNVDAIKGRALAVKGDLDSSVENLISPIEWADGFPSTPEDFLVYEEMIVSEFSPRLLDIVLGEITNGLEKRHEKIFDDFLKSVNFSKRSELANRLIQKSDFSYEFRPKGVSLCIPCSPPRGCHICSGTLYQSTSTTSATKYERSFVTNNNRVYTYFLDCHIHFLLEEPR